MSHPLRDESLQVLVVGPAGSGRERIERTLRRLGHEAAAAEPWSDLGHGDVVVLDARGGDAWRGVAGELVDDPRPMLVVADDPRDLAPLMRERGGLCLALTGQEREAAYAMALNLCARMARTGAGRMPALATAAA